jgi:hypothetical protein
MLTINLYLLPKIKKCWGCRTSMRRPRFMIGSRVNPLLCTFFITWRKLINSLVLGFLPIDNLGCQEIACFKDPGGSLACSLRPGLWRYSEPPQSLPLHIISLRLIQIVSCHLHLADLVVSTFLKGGDSICKYTIPCLLWNPKFRYSVHKSRPPVPMQSTINPVNTLNNCRIW